MNVLILTTHLNSGGITSYLLTLSRGLVDAGNAVFIVSGGGNMIGEFSGAGVKHTTLNIRTKSELDPRIYWPLGRLARFIKEKRIDVIHSQTRITQVMGQCLGKMTKRPFVSTCHGFFKTRLSRRIFPCWGDAVIAISPAVKEHLTRDFGLPGRLSELIRNGIDVKDFPLVSAQMREQKRKKFNIMAEEPVIGIIARLSDVKGHTVLIGAMSRVIQKIPTALLMIVGTGKMESFLKAKVRDMNLEDHVRFCPVVNRIPEYLAVFDIFVMPSLQEGLGLSVIEAQAAGLPVVASDVGGIPALIVNGQTGLLVEPKDTGALAQAIVELLENPQKAKDMGARAHTFIEREFSAERMVGQTLELYRKLVN